MEKWIFIQNCHHALTQKANLAIVHMSGAIHVAYCTAIWIFK